MTIINHPNASVAAERGKAQGLIAAAEAGLIDPAALSRPRTEVRDPKPVPLAAVLAALITAAGGAGFTLGVTGTLTWPTVTSTAVSTVLVGLIVRAAIRQAGGLR